MKAILIVALFALFAVVANAQNNALFCNYTDTACATANFCNLAVFGACTFTSATGPYFVLTGNASTGGNLLVYASATACFTSAAPLYNTTWSLNSCSNPGGFSYQVLPNTTQVWSTSYSYGPNSTCPIPGPSGSVSLATTGYCVTSNCSCPPTAYSCSLTAACTTGATHPNLPNNYIYTVNGFADSACSQYRSISGGSSLSTCTQTSPTTSSGAASTTCSTTQSVSNVYNTTGNCTGPIGSIVVLNGSCTLGAGGYYYTITCGATTTTGATTGATTTGGTTTAGTTTGATTSTGGTTATTSSASPVFVHAAVIILSVFVLLGLLL